MLLKKIWPKLAAMAIVFVSVPCVGQTTSRTFDLLRNSDVQNELDLTKEQMRSLDEAIELSGKERRDLLHKWKPHFGDPSRQSDITNDFVLLAKKNNKIVEKVLLPFQLTRLQQLVFRKQMRRNGGGFSALLDDKDFLEKMSITPEQKEKLQAKAKEVRQKLLVDIEKLVAKAEKDVVKLLTLEQQRLYEEIVGAPMQPMLGQQKRKPTPQRLD